MTQDDIKNIKNLIQVSRNIMRDAIDRLDEAVIALVEEGQALDRQEYEFLSPICSAANMIQQDLTAKLNAIADILNEPKDNESL